MVRKLAAELLGTGLLVVSGVGMRLPPVVGFGFAGFSSAGVVATALTFGFVLLALAYVLGPISGCHVNPAVTIGVWLSGRIPLAEAVGYWIAQFVGAILGALLLWGTFSASPLYSRSKTGLGTNGWGAAGPYPHQRRRCVPDRGDHDRAFRLGRLAPQARPANAATAGLVIGFSLMIVHLIGIPVTGTSVNPARSLGPALIVGGTALSQVWLFIVAPLVGGALAAGLAQVVVPGAPDRAASLGRDSYAR